MVPDVVVIPGRFLREIPGNGPGESSDQYGEKEDWKGMVDYETAPIMICPEERVLSNNSSQTNPLPKCSDDTFIRSISSYFNNLE